MHVIEERERERWGGTHAPPSPPQVHDAPVWQHSMGGYEAGDMHECQSMHEMDSNGMYDPNDPYVFDMDVQEDQSNLGGYKYNDTPSNPNLDDPDWNQDPEEPPHGYDVYNYPDYLQGYSNVEVEKPALVPREWWGGVGQENLGQPPQIESHDSLIELQALREGEGETPPLSEPEHAPTLEQITNTDFSGNVSGGEAMDLPHTSPRAKRPRKRSVIGVPGRQKVTLKMIKKELNCTTIVEN